MERSTIHLLAKRGRSIRQIAQELGRSPTTVARVLQEPVDRPPARRRRRSKVDPYRPQIEAWARRGADGGADAGAGAGRPGRAYPGGRSHFRAFVRRVRLEQEQAQAAADVPVRFEGLPGEYLQVDWGEVRAFPFARQAPATRYFLACRLKYSRWTWVRFTTDMRQETLFRGLVDCFVALGWVPWVLVFDNMKTVTSGRDAQPRRSGRRRCCSWRPSSASTPRPAGRGRATRRGASSRWSSGSRPTSSPGARSPTTPTWPRRPPPGWRPPTPRPSSATDVPPRGAAGGGGGPGRAAAADGRGDYGFLHPGRVTAEALVAVPGNRYSVPVAHVGAPVTVRVHRDRVASGGTPPPWPATPGRRTGRTGASSTRRTSPRCSPASRAPR